MLLEITQLVDFTEWLTWLSAFAYSAAPLAPPECFPSNRKWWENCTERWADCRTAHRCSDCKKTAELSIAYHRSDCSSPKSLCRYESALAPSWCELNFRTSTSHNSLTRTANSENVHYQSITKCLTSGTCKGKSTFDRSAINFFTLINHKLARTSKHFLGPQLSLHSNHSSADIFHACKVWNLTSTLAHEWMSKQRVT